MERSGINRCSAEINLTNSMETRRLDRSGPRVKDDNFEPVSSVLLCNFLMTGCSKILGIELLSAVLLSVLLIITSLVTGTEGFIAKGSVDKLLFSSAVENDFIILLFHKKFTNDFLKGIVIFCLNWS